MHNPKHKNDRKRDPRKKMKAMIVFEMNAKTVQKLQEKQTVKKKWYYQKEKNASNAESHLFQWFMVITFIFNGIFTFITWCDVFATTRMYL